ncbi:MAG: DcaP family trimeric outer membrane transporter [Lysobacteraceae bacterium]
MTIQRRNKHSLLALAVAGALMIPLGASAQSEREAALEARVAELERLVMELAKQQAAAPAAPAARVPAGQQPIQATTISTTANPGTTFSYGGFIKVNNALTDYSDGNPAALALIRDFNVPGAIPVGGVGESAVFDSHAKYSRFWFKTDTLLDNGDKLGSMFELDFGVPTGGDERVTNRYNPSLRRAFLTYNNWLFGQEWSNFMELGALPESTDFLGPSEGMVFNRQSQIRYTKGPWSISVENPETTVLPYRGGARVVTDENTMPDITARYSHKAGWGFVSVAGILRQLRQDSASVSDSATGFGVSVTSKILFGQDDLRLMVSSGSGIGRYIGINLFEDAVADASGDLDTLDVLAAYASYRHVWTGTWRSNFTLGYASVDNDSAITGMNANAEASSARVNLFWSPAPKFDLGFEVSTGKRELENGTSGTMNRIDFQAKYAF